jgi:hypothetical protein
MSFIPIAARCSEPFFAYASRRAFAGLQRKPITLGGFRMMSAAAPESKVRRTRFMGKISIFYVNLLEN